MIARTLFLLLVLPAAVTAATRVELACDRSIPAIAFAAAEIERAAALEKHGLQQVLFNLPSGDWATMLTRLFEKHALSQGGMP
jgi:hypothetical protein